MDLGGLRRARAPRTSPRLRGVVGLLVSVVVALVVLPGTGPAASAGGHRAGGPEEAGMFAMPVQCYTPDLELALGACRLLPRQPGAPTLVVWGDSHAREMLTGIIDAIGERRMNLVAYVAGGCPPVDPGHGPNEPAPISPGCEKHNALAVRDLTHMVARGQRVQVVVAAGWELYRNALEGQFGRWQTWSNDYIAKTARLLPAGGPRLFRTMQRLGVRTHVIGQAPMIPTNPPACDGAYNTIDFDRSTPTDFAYPCTLPRSTVMVAAVPLRHWLRTQMRLLSPPNRGTLMLPAQRLCPDGLCPGVARGAEVWHDPVHISTQSSARLAGLFAPLVREVARLGRSGPR